MKSIAALFYLLVLSMALNAQDKAALSEITAAFDEIDTHFKDWPHYFVWR